MHIISVYISIYICLYMYMRYIYTHTYTHANEEHTTNTRYNVNRSHIDYHFMHIRAVHPCTHVHIIHIRIPHRHTHSCCIVIHSIYQSS